MDCLQKVELVVLLNVIFNEVGVVVIICNFGMLVVQFIVLCGKICDVGVIYKVVKNCFVKFVIQDMDYVGFDEFFMGLMVIVFLVDFVVVVKVVVDFVKMIDKIEIVGGLMGMQVLNVEGIKVFVLMLLFDELCVKFVGFVQVLVIKIVQFFIVLVVKLVCVFGVYVVKDVV